ncbi:MAG: ABC transporter substrate-binding protein [Alphaproteobacteria bacterium]|nr:ABC transporter substrate-binding protein [Alphaproteobacteria bacterium]MCZ6763625.1 ABC transporter substrate-binding protein [Alphaproteobacteria bacterium]
MKKGIVAAIAACVLFATPVYAQTVKIGIVLTLTTGAATIGNNMKQSMELAIKHMGGKMGDRDVELIFVDDGLNVEQGKQAAEQLVLQDDVDIVTGFIWSHILLASADTVLEENKILISANAGPSQLAGERCHKNFFNASWQNDQTPEAMGEVLNRAGVKSLYIIAPDYAAGRNMAEGVERTFNGEIVGKDLTVWPSQVDWATELSSAKAANPDGVFIFYPGAAGPAFISQYQQAIGTDIPLYTVFTIDSLSLPRFQEAGFDSLLGTSMTQFWAPDLDTPENKRFVADFRAEHGSYPAFYGAQAYDTMFLIKSAVEAVDDLDDTDALRAALEKADFNSVRGDFRFGNNHFPIQNFYEREVVVDADGNWTTSLGEAVLVDHQDAYASSCKF